MGVIIDITACRRCARLRLLLASRDYTCADCDQKRIAALGRRADRVGRGLDLFAVAVVAGLLVGLLWSAR